MDNSILCSSGELYIYDSDIAVLENDYILSLNMKYEDAVNHIKSDISGLLFYIYNNKLKYILQNDISITGKKYNISFLHSIFLNIYIPICYKYNNVPSMIQFCVLCNKSNKYISNIINGAVSSREITSEQIETLKGMMQVCETASFARVSNKNSVGNMFLLKAVYGYQEQPNRIEISVEERADPAALAEKYSAIALPEMQEDELQDNSSAVFAENET